MDEKMSSNPQISFVFSSKMDPSSQTPHQSQEEGEQKSSGSLALTTRLGPSTGAPVAAAQCRCQRIFSYRISLPQR